MELNFAPRGILQIDNARITWKNFSGAGTPYNREGDRNFAVVIPDQEVCDALLNDKNKYGDSWNVKIKAGREDGDAPRMCLPVKVKFNERGPIIYLISGNSRTRLTEETVHRLDKIDIASVSLDIRPYDGLMASGKHFRSAYLSSMEVIQDIDRFTASYAEEEDDERPF